MKKTVSVNLGTEDFIIALMNDINFLEVDRVACGGTMSSERLQLTFEGYEYDYNENGYIEVPHINDGETIPYSWFYSIQFPEGSYEKSLDNFKDRIEKKKVEIEVKHFNP